MHLAREFMLLLGLGSVRGGRAVKDPPRSRGDAR